MKARFLLAPLGFALLLGSCGQIGQTATTPEAPVETALAPLIGTDTAEAIAGQYIVVFKDNAQNEGLTAQSTDGLVGSLNLNPQGVSIQHVYDQALSGFAAQLSSENINKLRLDPRVDFIEQDSKVYANTKSLETPALNTDTLEEDTISIQAVQKNPYSWGLDRIDQRKLPLNKRYKYTKTGRGVTAYIIDTGINIKHKDFGRRARWGINTTKDKKNTDCNGHGTHVAGTVGGKQYGVAKRVNLVAVKVLNCQGSGTYSGVIAGINWVVKNRKGRRAVANMSLGGGKNQAINKAVNKAVQKGVNMVVAAGNNDKDACNYSPASAKRAISVGATDRNDKRSTFSNYGKCLDLFAPGTEITSAWIGNNTAKRTISGTSMAAPHVAGAAALLLEKHRNWKPARIKKQIIKNSTKNLVKNAGYRSPNRLLYTAP